MSKKPFDKFINKKESGAKKKEKIRQEKKQLRAEKNAYFDELKRQAKANRNGTTSNKRNEAPQGGPRKRDADKSAPVKKTGSYAEFKSKGREADRKTTSPAPRPKPLVKKEDRPSTTDKRPTRFADRKEAAPAKRDRPVSKPFVKTKSTTPSISKPEPKSEIKNQKPKIASDEMPLNKFIAWSGVCGRREAADLIKAGKVTVNGALVIEPPFRVSQQDDIKVNGKKISVQKNLVYILLNKPKDYITTTDDPEGRKTVMDLIKRATPERVFPVGRLDRNTTGVLLLTNDGEVAQRLTHPKYEVKKIYEVKLDKPVTKQQLDTIANGITLEDGFIQPDAVAYADATDKSVIGIEIHSGRNRIVRRLFEHLGFDVKNLDRVMYGIFTKKNVDRGKWRFLSEKEIRLLKHLNTSFAHKKTTR